VNGVSQNWTLVAPPAPLHLRAPNLPFPQLLMFSAFCLEQCGSCIVACTLVHIIAVAVCLKTMVVLCRAHSQSCPSCVRSWASRTSSIRAGWQACSMQLRLGRSVECAYLTWREHCMSLAWPSCVLHTTGSCRPLSTSGRNFAMRLAAYLSLQGCSCGDL
jgi:hypothetical protein